ncbi:phosphate-starvation-inducible PsiE family protein [Tanticharoenia sakaeratensis]|jgi:uncharacterized membrane protein (DUF373 family)|nr:phosphate-starvation-inducible PsiE family protein [Tanticharoenia sakaeratensis]GBQ18492.1 hypothetical protein AA103193_0706 [Tanticharoenia sakaeratensis NBRC 103193]
MNEHIPGFSKFSKLFDLFEELSMLVLTIGIMVIAAIGLFHVVVMVAAVVLSTTFAPTSPAVLQSVFALFFTVLIALEFKHSILVLPEAQSHSMIRMRSVLLIGMMATVRKFIVLDLNGVNVLEMLALSAAVLALGSVYWLVRDRPSDASPRLITPADRT